MKFKTLILTTLCVTLAVPCALQAAETPATKWVEVLKSNAGRKEKADACRELAHVGDKEAVATLAGLLQDPELSHMARYGLETIPGPEVDQVLREALTKVSGRLRAGVIGSLGVRRDANAVPEIAKFLADKDADVASAAARALGRIGSEPAAAALQSALRSAETPRQPGLCEGLFRCAERFTAEGKGKTAMGIYDLLAGISTLPQVRAGAVRGLILSGGPEGLKLLGSSLVSPDPAIAAVAIRTAQEMENPAATEVLVAALKSLGPDQQVQVLQALGKRRDKAALPAVYEMARTGKTEVRIVAMHAVSQIADPASAGTVARWMSDSDPAIAGQAREVLAALPGDIADAVVLGMLTAANPGERATGLDLLERRRMISALPQVLNLTKDPDAKVRTSAIRKVAVFSKPADPSALLAILSRSTAPEDLEAAEQALQNLGSRSPDRDAYARTLSTKLANAAVAQKCALVRVIGAMGTPEAFGLVKECIGDSEAQVRSAATRIYATWDKPEAAPVLLELAQKSQVPADKTVCLRSYIALTGNGEIAVPQKLAMCKEARPLIERTEEKRLLLGVLGNIPHPEAVGLIEPYVGDESVRGEALTAGLNVCEKVLQQKPTPEVAAQLAPWLEQAAKSDNTAVAEKAKKLQEKLK